MSDAVVMEGVRKHFGATRAVDGLTLRIGPGTVVGFVGLNGAGKTTAMRLMAGLIRAEAGSLSVLGEDPWTMGPATRRRVGYLSEKDFPMPAMTLEAATSFTSRLYPSWDGEYMAHLVRLLQVPGGVAYSALSRGQQRKFQLALTLAPRPELLLLDDPAQGLDVSVRREFVEGILPLLHEGRSTVLFSSHIMSDIERIADSVAIVHEGRLVLQDSLDRLKEHARRVVVAGEDAPPLPGAVRVRRGRGETRYTVLDGDPQALRALGDRADVQPVTLEDLFIDLVSA